uniref:Outer surface protein C n=1 Tax=Borreliella afzelii TaxID=29518 RepID=Q8G8H5_BORAF|nr:outer surface protein C precursor [Borreliella afzelii]AAO17307.1 outer surface protein C precursor [Borreliella afzelii]
MKKNTLSAILMTLFLFISCNNSGKGGDSASTNPADESAKGPNLTEISKKITDSNAFVLAVKEVETLVLSIDELAKKAIGQKIDNNNGLAALNNQNGSLLAGAYAISALITKKLDELTKNSGELKGEVEKAKKCSEEFTNKLKNSHAELGAANGATTDENAKKAILKTHGTKDKGAEELEKLFKSVEGLSKAAKESLTNSVKELTNPVVAESPKKP